MYYYVSLTKNVYVLYYMFESLDPDPF